MVWGDGFLYLNLYAADEDIRASETGRDGMTADDDFFHLVFSDGTMERVIDINALGVTSETVRVRGPSGGVARPWTSGTHVSHELDGTPNHPGDSDEEWVLEVAIPFEALALRGEPGVRIGLAMRRCDTPRHGSRVCGSWGEDGAPRTLILDSRTTGPVAPVVPLPVARRAGTP